MENHCADHKITTKNTDPKLSEQTDHQQNGQTHSTVTSSPELNCLTNLSNSSVTYDNDDNNSAGNKIKKERVNGLVIPNLKSHDEYEQTESADSGHGSSCQDCECGSGETEVTILSEGLGAVSLDNELSESESGGGTLRSPSDIIDGLQYVVYESEHQMPDIMSLITKDLSEPYSIYTYRYFIHNWPKLCFLAKDKDKCIGAIVCKLDMHKKMVRRGYIAMLAIDSDYRRRRIGSNLVTKAIRAMIADDCDEVVLETEITNKAALKLYENLGFVRDKRLFRYYLNGVDALRLKLWLR